MYYITNQTGQIIAADQAFLTLVESQDMDACSKRIAKEEINLKHTAEHLVLTYANQSHTFEVKQTEFIGILGTLHLLELTPKKETDLSTQEAFFTLNDTADTPHEDTHQVLEKVPPREEERRLLQEEETLFDPQEKQEDDTPEEIEKISLLEEEIFSITTGDTPTTTHRDDDDTNEKETNLHTAIQIDLNTNSEKLGLSTKEYTLFLNDYIDRAILLESDLQSETPTLRHRAVEELVQLTELLQLTPLKEAISQIEHAASTKRQKEAIEAFYAMLMHLSTSHAPHVSSPQKTPQNTSQEIQPSSDQNGSKTIDLSTVAPIHFDFQLKEAANDLGLPVELIEEFIQDFILQARSETQHMLEAYNKGDLSTINKIGHLLKGASSNLRINPLADTLYTIQFCENIDDLEPLIREYWGHFLSFEKRFDTKQS
jgi:hypothetical protein